MPPKTRPTTSGVIVSVYVHPSAKRDKMTVGEEIEIHTREPAEGNRANVAVIKMMSKALAIPRSSVSIVRGSTSRMKEFHIAGVSQDRLASLISKDGIEKAQG